MTGPWKRRNRKTAVFEHQLGHRTVLLRVYRHNPSINTDRPRMESFQLALTDGMTVLDALLWVKEHIEPSLAFRCSCRMGICGSCGMLINDEPRLACETQVSELGHNAVDVAPLPNFPVIRDLATNFQSFFSRHQQIKPYMILKDDQASRPVEQELLQTEKEKLDYYQFAMCIMCGLCDAACPIVAMDPEFLGPQALAQSYRFVADSRDQGWPERASAVDKSTGCWRCRIAGSCSAVCPKGVDPALGVQLLKRKVLRQLLSATS